MTDVQILTLALTLLGIFAASWFNNSRINDVKDVFRAELKTLETGMDLQFERSSTRFERMDNKFERMDNKIDTLLKMVADIDTRVTALESRKI